MNENIGGKGFLDLKVLKEVIDDLCLIEETTVKLYGTVCTDISFIAKQLNMANETIRKLEEENNEFKINEEFKNKAYSDLLDNFTQLKKKYQKSKKENKELKYKYDEQSNEKMGLEEDIDRLLKDNKELKYHLNRTEKELKEYKEFMCL